MTFDGFVIPTKNYFPMPNNWIDICASIDNLAELKVVQYVLRHTWGYHEYGITKTITVEEFMRGRKRNDGSRIDNGTGLKSDRSVKDGLKAAIKHEYLMCEVDESDKARIKKSYGLKMAQSEGYNLPPELGQVVSTPQDSENRQVVSTPLTGSIYPSEVQNLPLGGAKSTPRSEKDTLEKHLEKDTLERQDSIPLSASAEESMPTKNVTDIEKWKEDTAERKAVSLHVASSDYQKEKEEDTGERERVIRPVLTIGGGKQHDRNDLSGDWSSLPGAVHDKPRRGLSSPGGVGPDEPAGGGGGQTETAPAPAHPLEQTPDAGTSSLAATPPGDGQDDGTRDQALPALPDAGQVASAPAASTALGVFSPPPTSGVQQGAAGHTPKPRLKKTVIVKDTAGPPAFPSESDAWGTTTCLRLFDFWRGAPLCDLGQLKYASSCAKRLAETYSRVQVVLVRTAMNNQTFWKEQGGADVCDVARHMSKELNKLKMPAPPEQPVDIYTQASLDPERNQRNIDRLRAKTAARLQQASGE